MAQSGSARGLGPRGRRFKSCLPDHVLEYNTWMEVIFTVLTVFALIVGNEFWYRKKGPRGEFSRKFVHITVGSFVAFWPFFLTWQEIRYLSLAFLLVVSVSRLLGVFKAIHSVQRPTWGEVFFACSVGAITLITENQWVYAAALLQMSLADGMAAIIGTRYGSKYKYLVFGYPKSIAGTATFFIISFSILYLLNGHFPDQLSLAAILAISAVASLFENIFIMGFDNLAVPILVAALII